MFRAIKEPIGILGNDKKMTDRHALLSFLVEEALGALLRAQHADTSAATIALNEEAEELTAIRLNILRRQDNEAQLELQLEIKAAA